MAKSMTIGSARVVWRGDEGYEQERTKIWNARKPDRHPEVIVTVNSDQDVAAAIAFARAHSMKVAVRGGGHSMSSVSLRDGGMLIDLSRLRGLGVDRNAQTAWVQPAVTSGELASALAKEGLAFPIGHQASVPMSGFLLSGGLGWNVGAWGPACFSVERLEVVTAEGRVVSASEQDDPDLFWAARGAGSGFFGVVTRFHLRAKPLPRAMMLSAQLYPLADLEQVGRWLEDIGPVLPPSVELQVNLASAPPGVPAGPAGKAMSIVCVAFADTVDEASRSLKILGSSPAVGRALMRQDEMPVTFDMLFAAVGAKLPSGRRYLEESVWSQSGVSELLPLLAEQLVGAPSEESFILSAMLPASPQSALPDAAFSMVARTFLLMYAIWAHGDADAENERWLSTLTEAVQPFAVGHYIAETELRPDRGASTKSQRSFAPANWQRLEDIRQSYDPEGVFFSYLDR